MRSPSLLALLLLLIPCIAQAQSPSQGDVGQLAPQRAAAQLASASISFTENRGQWPEQVRLAAQIRGLDLWITNSSILYDPHTIQAAGQQKPNRLDPATIAPPDAVRRRGHLVMMEFAGASAASVAGGDGAAAGTSQLFHRQ